MHRSSLKDSHLSAAARRFMTELIDAQNATNPEAKTEIVALDPDLAPMTKDMSFFETGKMNVMIDVSEDAGPANFLGTASHSEFAGCYHKILATDGAFYRDLLFPDISGRIKDYNFDQAFF